MPLQQLCKASNYFQIATEAERKGLGYGYLVVIHGTEETWTDKVPVDTKDNKEDKGANKVSFLQPGE